MDMNLPFARLVGQTPAAFTSETLAQALLVLRGQKERPPVAIKGDPDAPKDLPSPMEDMVKSIGNVLRSRHERGV